MISVYKIINTYKTENRVDAKLKGGSRNKKLNEEEIIYIKQMIDEDCTFTLRNLQSLIIQKFDKPVLIVSISNAIKGFSYSFKRISLIPERRNNEENIEVRKIYAINFFNILTNYNDRNIFYEAF